MKSQLKKISEKLLSNRVVKKLLQKDSPELRLFFIAFFIMTLTLSLALTFRSKKTEAPKISESPNILGDTDTVDLSDPGIIQDSTETPSEEKPLGEYKVAPKDPKILNIHAIGIKANIQKVGIDQKKQIAVPSNIHNVGWYVHSSKPGARGLSIIDGHIDGVTQKAVFSELHTITKGDTFEVEFGDASKKEFLVVDVVEVELSKADAVLFAKRADISNQLNLITCIGSYNKNLKTYDKRLIVISRLVSDS